MLLMLLCSCLCTSLWTFLTLLKEGVAVNVALNRKGEKCFESDYLDTRLFDGDFMETVILTNLCEQPLISVLFSKDYIVSYHVLYAGEGIYKYLNEYLTFSEEANSQGYSQSGVYDGITYPYMPSRTNINHRIQTIRTALFYFHYPYQDLNITELEVHTFDTLRAYMHRGCYKDEFKPDYTGGKTCLEHCYKKKKLFAVMRGELCSCTDREPPTELPLSDCYLPCKVKNKFCGGIKAVSLYFVYVPLPHFDHCRIFDVDTLDYIGKNEIKGEMTIEKCLLHCEEYEYALLHSGDTCLCDSFNGTDAGLIKIHGDHYKGLSIRGCRNECSADPNNFCGGHLRFSFYKTCQGDMKSNINCSTLLRCAKSYDKFGMCRGGCARGFFGEYCLERDVDECKLRPCKSDFYVCKNLPGSFSCNCKAGYKMSSAGDCLPIPEPCDDSFLKQVILYLFITILTMFIVILVFVFLFFKASLRR